jgi:hypothetical protein
VPKNEPTRLAENKSLPPPKKAHVQKKSPPGMQKIRAHCHQKKPTSKKRAHQASSKRTPQGNAKTGVAKKELTWHCKSRIPENGNALEQGTPTS